MKKLILMLLVLAGGVVNVSAQITESGKLKLYLQNNNNWATPYLYVKGNDASSTEVAAWPGTNISSNTVTIDGNTYLYMIVDLATLNNATAITINFNDGSSHQSYDWENIKYDAFFSISTSVKETSGGWNKYELTRENKCYLYNTSTGISTKLNYVSGNVFSATIDNSNSDTDAYYVVANTDGGGAFNWGNDFDWSKVWRPWNDYNSSLGFQTIEITSNNAYYGSGDNSWKFTAGLSYIFSFDFTADGANYKFGLQSYFTRDLGSAGYATFSSAYNVAIPDGVKAYYATSLNDGKTKINMTKLSNGIAANEGAFLQGTGEKTFTPATSTDAATGNMLKPTTGSDIYDSSDSKSQYVFAKQGGELAFYQVKSSLSPAAGKAYLETSETLAAGARLSFVFDDEEVSGINTVKATTAGAEGYYNLAGQRVASPTKGLYIVNGKKVIIK